MKYFALWFEGPLQAWGADSKFGLRSSLLFPTKSGIYGVLLAAMGRGGEQVELLESLSACKTRILSYEKHTKTSLMTDYHVVGNGYDDKDVWQNLMIPKKRDGGKAVGGGVKLTYRQYLQDAVFGVIQEVPDDISDELINALQNPVWPIYLGRKSCVPSFPVFAGAFDAKEDAESKLEDIRNQKGYQKGFIVEDGAYPDDGAVQDLNDVPICFGPRKKYRDRYITVIKPDYNE